LLRQVRGREAPATAGRMPATRGSLVRLGGWGRGVDVVLGLALALFEFGLAAVRGFRRVGTGFDFGLLGEIAPSGVAVFGGLALFILLDGGLRITLALDDLDDSAGFVGADVVTDDGVEETGFVARQKTPVCSRPPGLRDKLRARGLFCFLDYTPVAVRAARKTISATAMPGIPRLRGSAA
jgi:hypothetical protein